MTAYENLYVPQKENVDRLAYEDGCLIADQPGTGKTIQGVAIDEIHREQFKFADNLKTLVVAPLSVMPNWKDHFEKYTDLKVRVLNTKSKETRGWLLKDTNADVFVVHWEALRLMPELKNVGWLHIIVDECHRAQNRAAQQTTSLKKIKASYLTALSGTPVTTSPEKFWTILNYLYPQLFPSYWKFYGKYVDFEIKLIDGGRRKYHEIKGPRLDTLPELHAKIAPFYCRHLKLERCCEHHPNGVQPFLPKKYYTQIEVELAPAQRKAYDAMKKDMLAWIGPDEDKPLAAPMAIAKLVRLGQLTCAYANIDATGNVVLVDPSSKLDAVMEMIKDTDDKLVVFSQYRQLINLLNARLKKAKINYVSLTGETPGGIRGGLINKFQTGDAQVFTATTGAGGTGVTLTAASRVVFTDRSWSPAINEQAEDRLHRIGQANAVEVVDIMAKSTVDLGRYQRLEVRAGWLKKLLGDS